MMKKGHPEKDVIRVARPIETGLKQVRFSDNVKINYYKPEPQPYDTWPIDLARGHRMLHSIIVNMISRLKLE